MLVEMKFQDSRGKTAIFFSVEGIEMIRFIALQLSNILHIRWNTAG